MSTQEDKSLGYTCPCGKWHEAGMWAAAHWFEQLTHVCGDCKRTNIIKNGRILPSKGIKK